MKRLIPIIILFVVSCSSDETSLNTEEKEDFQAFLRTFPEIDLPLEVKACEIDYSNLTYYSPDTPSIYIEPYSYALGKITTESDYIATISLATADCMLPVITTYKITGEMIDQKTVAIGACGCGPCFECQEYMILREDHSIYTADSMVSSICDEEFDPIPGTETISIIYRVGKLKSNGTVHLSEEREK